MNLPRTLALLLLLLGAAPASAQPAMEVSVLVGKTVRLDVGLVHGLNCDDLSIVAARLEPSKDKTTVFLVLTGKKVGETDCRAGTGLGRSTLVHVSVDEPEP